MLTCFKTRILGLENQSTSIKFKRVKTLKFETQLPLKCIQLELFYTMSRRSKLTKVAPIMNMTLFNYTYNKLYKLKNREKKNKKGAPTCRSI